MVTNAATLQFVSVADELQQSCCLMSVFSFEILGDDGCCCEKDDYILWFWNDSA